MNVIWKHFEGVGFEELFTRTLCLQNNRLGDDFDMSFMSIVMNSFLPIPGNKRDLETL